MRKTYCKRPRFTKISAMQYIYDRKTSQLSEEFERFIEPWLISIECNPVDGSVLIKDLDGNKGNRRMYTSEWFCIDSEGKAFILSDWTFNHQYYED